VFLTVVMLHAALLWSSEPLAESVAIEEKKRVQTLDLRQVTIETPKPKPHPRPKPKVKPKPKPVAEPMPLPEPEPIDEPEIAPEPEPEPVPESSAPSSQVPVSEAEVIKAAYIAAVKAAIEAKKYYPRKAKRLRREGIVEVRFTIGADGTLGSISLAGASRYRRLNDGALQTLRDVGRVAPIPEALGLEFWEIVVPIVYRLQ
jgi:periplasmic protein TonB